MTRLWCAVSSVYTRRRARAIEHTVTALSCTQPVHGPVTIGVHRVRHVECAPELHRRVCERACTRGTLHFVCSNIRVNCPFDAYSRWQSASNTPPQYITLRLCRPAIVHGVYFGKGDKPTVCNVRHFKVYGSVHSGWVELADGCVSAHMDSTGFQWPEE
jgi:hypothetical protein